MPTARVLSLLHSGKGPFGEAPASAQKGSQKARPFISSFCSALPGTNVSYHKAKHTLKSRLL